MTPRNDSITRRECPVHGDTVTSTDWCISSESHEAPCRERVERTYVAVDALLSDEAIERADVAMSGAYDASDGVLTNEQIIRAVLGAVVVRETDRLAPSEEQADG